MKPKFEMGRLLQTQGVLKSVSFEETTKALVRHLSGDWGEVGEEDKETNNEAVTNGFRILSAYTTEDGIKFWIITEADRSVTTFLLPDEY